MSQDRLLDPLWVDLPYEFVVSHCLELTESDRTDGIHDCIQLCWASLYTKPYKLWSNSNAHHVYSTNSMMILYAEKLNMNEHSYVSHITCPRCLLSVISRMYRFVTCPGKKLSRNWSLVSGISWMNDEVTRYTDIQWFSWWFHSSSSVSNWDMFQHMETDVRVRFSC